MIPKTWNPPVLYANYMSRWENLGPRRSLLFLGLAVLAVTLAYLLGCATTTSPVFTSTMQSEWDIALCRVSHLIPPPPNPQGVSREGLRIIEKYASFQCDNYETDGCFNKTRMTITYNIYNPSVLRHEFGHYILYKLHDSRWSEYEHHLHEDDPMFTRTYPREAESCQ